MKLDTGFTLLSLDPGSRNFGVSALNVKRGHVKLIECGLLGEEVLLRELKEGIMERRDVFRRAWGQVLGKYKPNEITAERYMSQRQGLSNEFINWMIGAIWLTSPVPMTVYNAATWKARAKQWLGGEKDAIEQFYRLCGVGNGERGGVKDHAVDATLNGLYYLEKYKSVNVLRLFHDPQKFATEIYNSYVGALQ